MEKRWWNERKIDWYERASLFSDFHTLLSREIEPLINKDETILEFGSGLGYVSEILAKDGYNISSYDIDEMVIERAKEIVEQLLANDITETVKNISVETGSKKHSRKQHLDEVDMTQISLFDTVKDDDIIEELKNIDIGNLTPLDALNKLYQLQNKVKNRW